MAVTLAGGGQDGDSPGTPLPFSLGTLNIYQDLPAKIYAWVRYSDGSHPTDALQKLDIRVCDEDGRVCVDLNHFCVRTQTQVQPEQTQAASVLYSPHWVVEQNNAPTNEDLAQNPVLLIGGFNEQACTDLKAAGVNSQLLEVDAEDIGGIYTQAAQQLFTRIKTHLDQSAHSQSRVQVVFNSNADNTLASLGGLSGLLRTAKHENPKVNWQCVEVAADIEATKLAGLLLADLNDTASPEIRYSGDSAKPQRSVKRWKELSTTEAKQPSWKDNGVYLITGGLGGLGFIVANAIAERTIGAKVVLTGRSTLTDSARDKITELEGQGLEVDYQVTDVSVRASVDKLMESIDKDYGRLNGVIHSAGVIEDNFMLNKSDSEFARVLAPKVSGLVNLDEASRGFELDYFVCFSSLAGAFGNAGQVDYAAANGFMDNYAHYRNQQVETGNAHGQTVSINWPLWSAGGMQVDKATLLRLQQLGQAPLTVELGLSTLENCLNLSQSQLVVFAGNAATIRTLMAAADKPAAPQAVQSHSEVADSDQLQDETLRYFKMQLSQALEMSQDLLDVDAALEGYGMDSILAMDLTAYLERSFGPLSKTLFFEVQTVREAE